MAPTAFVGGVSSARSEPFSDLAAIVVDRGLSCVRAEVNRLVRAAAARGASPCLLSIVQDEALPEVVRQRALGRVLVEVANPHVDSPAKAPLQVLPNHTFDDHPALDVLLVPGGAGARHEENNPTVLEWIEKIATRVDWVTSVCTGAGLLHAAGPARGRRAATDWEFEDELEARGDITVVPDARYVVDSNLVTSQGVSAGIDMALSLIGRIHGRDHARFIRRKIQYEPAPPYLADEPMTV